MNRAITAANSFAGDDAMDPVAEGNLSTFFELSLDLLCVAGFDGFFKRLNPAWERTLGIPLAELYAEPFLDFVHPDDREQTSAEAARLASGAKTVEFVNRYRSADGTYRWLSWTAAPDTGGELIYAVARDITAQRHNEQELRTSEQRFRTLIDSAPGGILIVDVEGKITLANRLVGNMFGYDPGEMVGLPVERLVPETLRLSHQRLRGGFAEKPSSRPMGKAGSVRALRRDGSELLVAIGLAPLPGENGTLFAATITDMTEQHQVAAELTRTNDELEARIRDLQELGREADLLSEMGEMFQASQEGGEAHTVIELFAGRLFPRGSGAVGLINESRNLVESVVTWGGGESGEPVFEFRDCWALRRGKRHDVGREAARVLCPHLHSLDPSRSICVPLLAQGEAIGVLTLISASNDPMDDAWTQVDRLSANFAEHLALALANLRLRSTLQTQSIRDPVTGLFNRRYLEESLDREVARAERRKLPLGVIMLDLDHFKTFNDAFGHRAGDAALIALGSLLPTMVRREDIPCRYGGEEFAIILPDADLEQVTRRAEQMRAALAEVQLSHADRELGRLTLSAGVAAFPDHGTTSDDLIQAADRALYRAKSEGRNRVVAAEST